MSDGQSRRQPEDGLMTPYHTVLEPSTPGGWPLPPIVADRLGMNNPAVLGALVAEPDSWDRALTRLMSEGATDEEILHGHWIELLPLVVRRYITTRLVELRAEYAVVDEPLSARQPPTESGAELSWSAAGEQNQSGLAAPRTESRGFRQDQIRSKVQQLRVKLDRGPTLAETAEALNTTESTLKRAVRDLGLGPWPPAPPLPAED